jgi:hypothetical protein
MGPLKNSLRLTGLSPQVLGRRRAEPGAAAAGLRRRLQHLRAVHRHAVDHVGVGRGLPVWAQAGVMRVASASLKVCIAMYLKLSTLTRAHVSRHDISAAAMQAYDNSLSFRSRAAHNVCNSRCIHAVSWWD